MFRIHCIVALVVFSASILLADEPRAASRDAILQELLSTPAAQPSAVHFSMQGATPQKKSPALAALLSLAVPGLGEHYAGDFSAGKYLVVAEGALWLTYGTFHVYGNSLRDDARAFAALHAGFSPAGKDDQFYVDVGNFINTQEFNEKRLRERSPERLYDPQAGFFWQWDSDGNRAEFREKRISAETVLNNRKFVVAAIVVNHIVSAINAARLAIAHNNALLESLGALDLRADVMGGVLQPHGIRLIMTKTF
jgi:hypothetical protein